MKLHQTIFTRLSGDQPLDTFQHVVKEAVNDVAQQFEDEQRERQADTADMELRRSVREEVTRSFRHRLRADAQDDLDEAVEAEFAKWPRGTKRHRLVAAIQKAVSRWSQVVEQYDAEQRRLADEAKHRRDADEAARKDQQTREELLRWPYLDLPYTLPQAERDRLLVAARKNMDKLPCGTPRENLVEARDAVIVPAVQTHERRKAAELRIDRLLLDAIESVIANEERDGLELDGPLDRVNFKFEVRDAIRGPLSDWLTPINGLNDDQLRHQIEWRARRCARELVPER